MAGIDPYASTQWNLVSGRTAVVVIDPQNDFLHLDGWYAKSGVDISHMRASIEPTKRLVRAARDRRVPVVWTRHGYRTMRDAGPFIEHRPLSLSGRSAQSSECPTSRPPHLGPAVSWQLCAGVGTAVVDKTERYQLFRSCS